MTCSSDILHGNLVMSNHFQGLSEPAQIRGKCMINAKLIPS